MTIVVICNTFLLELSLSKNACKMRRQEFFGGEKLGLRILQASTEDDATKFCESLIGRLIKVR